MVIRAFVVSLSSLVLAACGGMSVDEGAAPAASRSALAAPATSRRIKDLKAEIRAIASANTTRTDNFDEVRDALRPLVDELVALSPPRDPDKQLKQLAAVWRNVWSNLPVGSPQAPVDLRQVFQVVTDEGYYYNLAEISINGRVGYSALRGAYEQTPEGFAIRFTRNGVNFGPLEGNLRKLADDIESGAVPILPFGNNPPPGGPIGITGLLTAEYVDEDLRISGGLQDPYFDANGNLLVPGRSNLLFILDRQATPTE